MSRQHAREVFKLESDSEALETLASDFAALAADLADLDIIEVLAELARGLMIERTQRGVSIFDESFRPYSEYWADRRAGAGLPIDRVNLTVHGAMLEGIAFDVLGPLDAELYVMPTHGGGNDTPRDEVAEYHQDDPERAWFGVSKSDQKRLEDGWIALTLKAMLRHIQGTRPLGDEVAQLGRMPEMVKHPDGPFAHYRDLYHGPYHDGGA